MSKNKLLVIATVLIFALVAIACEKSHDKDKEKPNAKGAKIDLSGGYGADTVGSIGGKGGTLDVSWDGSGGVKFLREGYIDTSFNLPDYPGDVDFGAVEWDAVTSTVVNVYESDSKVAKAAVVNGEYHMHFYDQTLYIRAGNVDVPVTGLKIEKGVKITLGLNGSYSEICADAAALNFEKDVEILGTLTAENLFDGGCSFTRNDIEVTSLDMGALSLFSDDHIFIRKHGLVTTEGESAVATGEKGGDGGAIYLGGFEGFFSDGDVLANGADGAGYMGGGNGGMRGRYSSGVNLQSWASFVNTGLIDASGGSDTGYGLGGNGAEVALISNNILWNAGDVFANGGAGGEKNYGGSASEYGITMAGFQGSVFNRGDLSANGGDGGYGGGFGGRIEIDGGNGGFMKPKHKSGARFTSWGGGIGDVINSGNIEFSGGDTLINGYGGYAGHVLIQSWGGQIKSDGRIEGKGGDGENYPGRNGGYLSLTQYPGEKGTGLEPPGDGVKYTNHGDLVIANDIILSGGDGTIAGYGGSVSAREMWSMYGNPLTATAKFVGFNLFDLNGGDGYSGGMGGYFQTFTYSAYIANSNQPAGPIVNRVDVEANGGLSEANTIGAYYGGNGGSLEFKTIGNSPFKIQKDAPSSTESAIWDETYVVNSGDIELNGSDGYYAGMPGHAFLYGYYFVKNSGKISANGGAGIGLGSIGSSGGSVQLVSVFKSVNLGSIAVNGGGGDIYVGSGGILTLKGGERAINTGNLDAVGGDSADSVGGSGGVVYLTGLTKKSFNTGKIDVRNGAGPEPGLIGHIYFDLVNVTPPDGTLGF